jgi:type VI secretion system protein VasD
MDQTDYKIRLSCIIWFLMIVLCGCTLLTPDSEKKRALSLSIQASPALNPDLYDRPSPLFVYLYCLNSKEKFLENDFIALYESGEKTLSTEMLSRFSLIISPASVKQVSFQIPLMCNFIGSIAGFRQFDQAQWRSLVAITPDSSTISLRLIANRISIALSSS